LQQVLRPVLNYFGKVRISGIIFLVILPLLAQGTVWAQQTATITGTTAVCQNATSPEITFTGFDGVAPYEFTYTKNGITQSSISTSAESNFTTVSVPTTAAGIFEYVLVSVTDANSNTFTITTDKAIVTISSLPSSEITGITIACATTVLTAVTDAVSPLYTWYKDNVLIEGQTGSTLVVTVSGDYKVKIKNGSNNCEQTSGVSTVTINTLPATSAIWHQ
jgi:trimeric autotransporter adhesin